MGKVDLSIVITAHNEGLLLYKTLESVFSATEELDKEKVKYEVIVHVDNGDDKTIECAKNFSRKTRNKIKIFENDFGDISQSRNFLVAVAAGRYITFLDGDDLISRNWYIEAYRILKKNNKCVVYPESILTFQGDGKHILTMQRTFDEEKHLLVLLSANMWGSVVMAEKKVFIGTPYIVMEKGYCHEDYAFNVQTLEKGIFHIVAEGTMLFYRRHAGSRLMCANRESLVLPRMDFFDLPRVKKIFEGKNVLTKDDEIGAGLSTPEGFRNNYLYKKVRGNWFLNYLVTPPLRLILQTRKKIRGEKSPEEIEEERFRKIVPEFVMECWREMNEIDIQLYPTRRDLIGTELYDAEYSINVGKAYAKLSQSFTHIPDYIFIVPWIVRGGADKVMLNYIKALMEIHPDWHIAVITTLNEENTWSDQLPASVDLYELGAMKPYLSNAGMDVLMTLLLVQLKCKKIHLINSELGYKWTKRHNLLVRSQYELNVSFFAEEIVKEWDGGRRIVSYENPGLFDIYQNAKNIFTDNMNIQGITITRNGFDEQKFRVHYQPVDMKLKKYIAPKEKARKVLWAGRITAVKMPELVMQIAENLEDVEIDFYGAIDEECYDEEMFEDAVNVNYCGGYNGFGKLPTDKYDLFLYTSKNDGVPNTILEATAAGLPIIASNDGGVGEFIQDGKTGILIKDFQKPDEYIDKIKKVYNGEYQLDKLVKNAQELLKDRHSWKKFVEVVRRDIG